MVLLVQVQLFTFPPHPQDCSSCVHSHNEVVTETPLEDSRKDNGIVGGLQEVVEGWREEEGEEEQRQNGIIVFK